MVEKGKKVSVEEALSRLANGKEVKSGQTMAVGDDDRVVRVVRRERKGGFVISVSRPGHLEERKDVPGMVFEVFGYNGAFLKREDLGIFETRFENKMTGFVYGIDKRSADEVAEMNRRKGF